MEYEASRGVLGGWLFAGFVAGLALGPVALVQAAGAGGEWRAPEVLGLMPAEVSESSGLAFSRREPGMVWTHSDSGGEPVLQALATDGSLRGTVRIEGVVNKDWEDMASFTLEGRAWLLVGDIGDNASKRADCVLHVIAEPDPTELTATGELVAPVAWTIPVRYPDGPRDCESVAVDAAAGLVYLLAKRVTPHGLYVLPLRKPAEGRSVPVATRVGEMPAFPQPTESQRRLPIPSGAYRAQPTGMDFAADGSAAVVLTYGDVLVYPRTHDESWAEALAKPPRILAPHGLPQAEAVALGADAAELRVTTEGAGGALLRYRREP